MTDQTLFVTGRNGKAIHTSRDCPAAQRARTIREADAVEIARRPPCPKCHDVSRDCRYCGDTYDAGGIGAHERYCEENPEDLQYP